MSNLTYDQRVQQIAKKMADIYLGASVFQGDKNTPHFNSFVKRTIDSFIPYAVGSVSAQAEAIRQYVIKESAIPADFTMTVEDYLIENGYVPTPEVTTTPNVEQYSN